MNDKEIQDKIPNETDGIVGQYQGIPMFKPTNEVISALTYAKFALRGMLGQMTIDNINQYIINKEKKYDTEIQICDAYKVIDIMLDEYRKYLISK